MSAGIFNRSIFNNKVFNTGVVLIIDTHDGVGDTKRNRKILDDKIALRRTLENLVYGAPTEIREEALAVAAPYIADAVPEWEALMRDRKVIADLLELNDQLIAMDDRDFEELLPFLH